MNETRRDHSERSSTAARGDTVDVVSGGRVAVICSVTAIRTAAAGPSGRAFDANGTGVGKMTSGVAVALMV